MQAVGRTLAEETIGSFFFVCLFVSLIVCLFLYLIVYLFFFLFFVEVPSVCDNSGSSITQLTAAEGDSWSSQRVIADGSALLLFLSEGGGCRVFQLVLVFFVFFLSVPYSVQHLLLSNPIRLSLPPWLPLYRCEAMLVSMWVCVCVCVCARERSGLIYLQKNVPAGSFVYVHLSGYLSFPDGWRRALVVCRQLERGCS